MERLRGGPPQSGAGIGVESHHYASTVENMEVDETNGKVGSTRSTSPDPNVFVPIPPFSLSAESGVGTSSGRHPREDSFTDSKFLVDESLVRISS